MRGLSKQFMSDLETGVLHPFLDRVRNDQTLDLQIRNNNLNIYYRGGNLIGISNRGGKYKAWFDESYAGKKASRKRIPARPEVINGSADVCSWLASFPASKQMMDRSFIRKKGEEREYQQLVVRDNNIGGVSRATDYYICDLEYAVGPNQFDMVGVEWPSTPSARKTASGRRLVLIEMKYGDGALTSKAGLVDHVRKIDAFLANKTQVGDMKKSMVTIFKQKHQLGLMNCTNPLKSFSGDDPLVIMLLANHDPGKRNLKQELAHLASMHFNSRFELKFATSSFMGYGLFKPALLTMDELLSRFEGCIR